MGVDTDPAHPFTSRPRRSEDQRHPHPGRGAGRSGARGRRPAGLRRGAHAPAALATNTGAAHRHGEGPRPDGSRRLLHPDPLRHQLPVAAVRRLRCELQRHQRRNEHHLHPRRRGLFRLQRRPLRADLRPGRERPAELVQPARPSRRQDLDLRQMAFFVYLDIQNVLRASNPNNPIQPRLYRSPPAEPRLPLRQSSAFEETCDVPFVALPAAAAEGCQATATSPTTSRGEGARIKAELPRSRPAKLQRDGVGGGTNGQTHRLLSRAAAPPGTGDQPRLPRQPQAATSAHRRSVTVTATMPADITATRSAP